MILAVFAVLLACLWGFLVALTLGPVIGWWILIPCVLGGWVIGRISSERIF